MCRFRVWIYITKVGPFMKILIGTVSSVSWNCHSVRSEKYCNAFLLLIYWVPTEHKRNENNPESFKQISFKKLKENDVLVCKNTLQNPV